MTPTVKPPKGWCGISACVLRCVFLALPCRLQTLSGLPDHPQIAPGTSFVPPSPKFCIEISSKQPPNFCEISGFTCGVTTFAVYLTSNFDEFRTETDWKPIVTVKNGEKRQTKSRETFPPRDFVQVRPKFRMKFISKRRPQISQKNSRNLCQR